MQKKIAVIFMALVISTAALTGCDGGTYGVEDSSVISGTASSVASTDESESSEASADNGESAFADGDFKDVESETPNATITLSGSEGTISDTTRGSSGSDVTITSKGIYEITGSSENVTITINDDNKSGNIYLILNDVTMTNSEKPCIYVENSEKVIIVCKGSSTLTYTAADNTDGLDGAIYAEDDVTINGSGTLTVDSSLHGIVCKDDLKVTGSTLEVMAASVGVKAGDSVRIGGGTITIESRHDGIQVQNKTGDSFFHMEDGTITINAGYDGIDVGTSDAEFTGYAKLIGGMANITSGGGSDNSKDSNTSQKGVKCDGNIILGDITLTVSSADDAVNSKGLVSVSGGIIELSTSDDGITTDGTFSITDGKLSVTKSYEALEAADVTIDGGDVSVVSTDDGINAGGGSDTSSDEQESMAASSGTITINGGSVYVNASGDGIDANGSIYITGGTVIVEGPTDAGNGAIDKGDGSDCVASITGGTVLALGTTGMAVNFDTGSQCSALVMLSGSDGDEITVDDGSDFSFTASKSFECAVYSSPSLSEGSTYTLTAGSNTASLDFSSALYFSDVAGGMGSPGQR